ncbi:hypothetical protein [Streptomyces glycanivorans]|uniref:ATP-binding protein n=1 Tax=Streptomyces glycanivorans TaxID=3033808 RepID=A0ABY9JNS7_9ACTN|nr:hypothetical protein [Streptomyces sp. Alt3]WLQ69360.1 hypothetical protein P8A20_38270 [Streptomyces sp. Alt3]
MSRDKEGGPARRPRVLARARVGWPRPLRELKDLVYKVYLAAGTPSLDEIAEAIRKGDLVGSPSRDTVRRCISDPSLPPSQADIVSIAAVLARLARWDGQDMTARVRGLWVEARMATGVGRPVGEFEDDLVLTDLEVHPALDVDGARGRLGVLPAYVPREFDRQVQSVVEAAEAGRSGLVALVGDSSTGKTRALWEAVRSLPEPWRLWHPLAPTRPDAVLAELADVAPHTVIWLNEAQFYLAPEPLGEQVAAGLRELLRDPARGPVLVMATLWPGEWQTLTTRTDPDRHTQARELLGGHRIDVPETFTPDDLVTLAATAGADPRLREAAERAQDRQVAQYLAGVLALMNRYHAARGVTRALVHAAMDARRLGAGPHIPLAWLVEAAPGYLTETEWNATDRDWLAQAIDYVTQDCTGIPGILTPVETTTPRNQRKRRPAGGVEPAGRHARDTYGPQYQLADYLDQYGRRHRADQIPPIDFWTTAASHAHPADLYTLGNAAWDRGLYRDSTQLHKHATTHGNGNPYAASQLIHHLRTLHPKDPRPAEWASTHAALDDPDGVSSLLNALREIGAEEQLGALLARDPATHVTLDNPAAVAGLLAELQEVGAEEQIGALLAQGPATHVVIDNPLALASLLHELRAVGAEEQIDALLAQDPAAHVALNDHQPVGILFSELQEIGAEEQLGALASRAAAHVALDNPYTVIDLLLSLRGIGAEEQLGALLARDLATHIPLDDPAEVGNLLYRLQEIGAVEQFMALAPRAAADVALDDPIGVAILLDRLRQIGAVEQFMALASRAAADVALDDPIGVAILLDRLRDSGTVEQFGALLARDPATHVTLDNPHAVAILLDRLREIGAGEQFGALLARDPATHVTLDNPHAVAFLLFRLRELGEEEQFGALLARDPATHVTLDNPHAVADLLYMLRDSGAVEQFDALLAQNPAMHVTLGHPAAVTDLLDRLREIGAEEQLGVLVGRLPAAGCFDQFREFCEGPGRFRFGREPEGSAAASWTWEDLE